MVQSAPPDEMLVKFLKFIQLEECLGLLEDELKVKRLVSLFYFKNLLLVDCHIKAPF